MQNKAATASHFTKIRALSSDAKSIYLQYERATDPVGSIMAKAHWFSLWQLYWKLKAIKKTFWCQQHRRMNPNNLPDKIRKGPKENHRNEWWREERLRSGSSPSPHHLVPITSAMTPVMSLWEEMVPIRDQIEDISWTGRYGLSPRFLIW